MKKATILVVDTNSSDLYQISQQLEQEGYKALAASSLEELDEFLEEKGDIQIALIELSGFDEGIWERCERMKEHKMPFIIIASQRSPAVQRDSVKHGAQGLLVKPVGTKELVEHINTVIGG